jgi:hypothetical protein
MGEVQAVITFGPMDPASPGPPRPTLIQHALLDLTWRVLQVLEYWINPRQFSVIHTEPKVRRRYQLRVHGPLPWRPGERGVFVVVVHEYTDRRGWWMAPSQLGHRHP